MADDPRFTFYEKDEPPPRIGRPATGPRLASHTNGPLILTPARLPDPRTIPPRQWLYGTQLVRSYVTVLVAPGGTGKSSYAMAVGVAIATGRNILNEHVFTRCNVAVFNLEDPMEELERRLAALQLRHRIPREMLDGAYFLNSGEDRRLVMAEMDDSGYAVIHPDEDALIEQISQHQVGLIVVDPFAESHSLEENSNPHMVKAASAWRRVARTTNCAIMLVHHVRKGAVQDIDSARGAKALTDSARVGLVLSSMSPEEAENLGIAEGERTLYTRLDDAKANMAPKASKARWFYLARVPLENATPAYPNGDTVAAIMPWEPTTVWTRATNAQLNHCLDIIAKPPTGWFYAPKRTQKDTARWAGTIIVDQIGCTEVQAQTIIAAWLKSGLLVEEIYRDTVQRKDRIGVRVVDAKRPTQ